MSGQPLCEPWYEAGEFVHATKMTCLFHVVPPAVEITYFTDLNCLVVNTEAPNGVWLSPHEVKSGPFNGDTLSCFDQPEYYCNNMDEVLWGNNGCDGRCHGGCGYVDQNGQFIYEDCEYEPPPVGEPNPICEAWFSSWSDQFVFATEMFCLNGQVTKQYFDDQSCTQESKDSPSDTYTSPHTETAGFFAGSTFICNNVPDFNCENGDRVAFDFPFGDPSTCHGGCGEIDGNFNYIGEDCELSGVDPIPEENELLCEPWYDTNSGDFLYATEMQCFFDHLEKTYYLDALCSEVDPAQPSGTYPSPAQPSSGPFSGVTLQCPNVAAFNCESEDRVSFSFETGLSPCHGGCGTFDANGDYVAEECANIGVDPIPDDDLTPEDGLLCEPWYDEVGELAFATQMQCVGGQVTKTYYVDSECFAVDGTQPTGTYNSPYLEKDGFFAGITLECPNVPTFECENEDRVAFNYGIGFSTCHGGCGFFDPVNGDYVAGECDNLGVDPLPEEGQLLCELWYDQSTGGFAFATEMQCLGDTVVKTYFGDNVCSEADPALPSGTYASPYLETAGAFEGATLQCSNVAGYNCDNEDRVSFSYDIGSSPCHGGCGYFDASGAYVEQPCDNFGVDPVPPSGGELICEPWFDQVAGGFAFATTMQCSGSSVVKTYYADALCTQVDSLQPSGTYTSPYEETAGFFVGFTLECPNVETFDCENDERVAFSTFGLGSTCHGGCGAIDSSGNYFEEPCRNTPGGGGSSDDGDYVGGIVGGMVACGAAIGLAVGGAAWYDKRKRRTRRGDSGLLDQPVYGGASFGPGIEMGESTKIAL
jgi:hypothetical protein